MQDRTLLAPRIVLRFTPSVRAAPLTYLAARVDLEVPGRKVLVALQVYVVPGEVDGAFVQVQQHLLAREAAAVVVDLDGVVWQALLLKGDKYLN